MLIVFYFSFLGELRGSKTILVIFSVALETKSLSISGPNCVTHKINDSNMKLLCRFVHLHNIKKILKPFLDTLQQSGSSVIAVKTSQECFVLEIALSHQANVQNVT